MWTSKRLFSDIWCSFFKVERFMTKNVPEGTMASFKSIPGPRSFPLIKMAPYFTPGSRYGKLAKHSFDKFLQQLYKDFGSLCRLEFPMKPPTVVVSDYEHIQSIMLHNNKPISLRTGAEALAEAKKAMGEHPGMVSNDYEEWKEARLFAQDQVGSPQKVSGFIANADKAATMYADYLRRIRRDENHQIYDMLSHNKRWAFESMNMMVLGHEQGLFHHVNEKRTKLIFRRITDTFAAIKNADEGLPLWKFYQNRQYKDLYYNVNGLLAIARDIVHTAIKEKRLSDDCAVATMIKKYRKDGEVAEEIMEKIITLVDEFLMAGVDTTGIAMTNVLYCLGKNPEAQQEAREEVFKIVPDQKQPLSSEDIAKMVFVKACFNESMRLKPVFPGTNRYYNRDIVLGGYYIPAGTVLQLRPMSAIDAEAFPNPSEFRPARFARGHEQFQVKPPFSSMPFGHGPRMCIGRRMAEIELWTCLATLLRNFEWKSLTDDYNLVWQGVIGHDRKIDFTFDDI